MLCRVLHFAVVNVNSFINTYIHACIHPSRGLSYACHRLNSRLLFRLQHQSIVGLTHRDKHPFTITSSLTAQKLLKPRSFLQDLLLILKNSIFVFLFVFVFIQTIRVLRKMVNILPVSIQQMAVFSTEITKGNNMFLFTSRQCLFYEQIPITVFQNCFF